MKFSSYTDDALNEILKCAKADSLSLIDGGYLNTFEKEIAGFWGNNLGLAFCNGTAAIHSALYALGVSSGDEVIVPTYGFHAMVTPILLLKAIPVFCDISYDTLCIEVSHIKKVVTKKTKGILLLHPWGNVADMGSLHEYSKQNNLFLLSDASHAHGASYHGRPIGGYADITCSSYGKGKLISGGELGGATTDSDVLWDRMAVFSHVNRVPNALKTDNYVKLTNSIGPKYRPHGLSLPLALDQIRTFNTRMQTLLGNIRTLSDIIDKSRLFRLQSCYKKTSRVFWKIVILIENKCPEYAKEKVFEIAKKCEVPIEGDHYSPLLHEDFNYREFYNIPSCSGDFQNAERLKNRIFQIHAPLLYDNLTANRYCEMFEVLESSL
jgi:perosamine synthetase